MLGPFFLSFAPGARPFSGFTGSSALHLLRELLANLGVTNASRYRTHDLRRGHARDLQANGSTLREILNAGDWRSPAFLTYLDVNQLEEDAIMEAHIADSSDSQ